MGRRLEQCSRGKCVPAFRKHSTSWPEPDNRAHSGWGRRTYNTLLHEVHRHIRHGIRLGSLHGVLQRHVQHRV
jgi:hypothetical protein